MTTARDLINTAYRKINILGQGSSLTSEEANDAFKELNSMLALWSIDGAMIYTETKETFNLTGAQSYTIGSGASFDTVVPKAIKSAYVTYSGNDYPVSVIDARQYSDIAQKDQSGITSQIYFDGNFPIATIYTWPVHTGAITLFTEKPLTSFSTLDTVFNMPPEYEAAIHYNLAVHMSPEFEMEASPTVKMIAHKSLQAIKAQNKKNNNNKVSMDGAYLRGRYDINAGRYR